ncbi:diguanylate cyclase domain-containing protein [Deinococcus aquaticus]|uniref:diguanylate cyclase domain-containing protein n=1 Tax=Deinococcus aquaticus TaxID=328692 RepID=UPI003F456E28
MPSSRLRVADSMTVLYRLAQAVLSSDDELEVLKLVVQAPVDLLGVHGASVITVDAGGIGPYVLAGQANMDGFTSEEFHEGLSGWVCRTGQVALSSPHEPDARESARVQARRAGDHCGHIVVLPLQGGSQVIGTLTVITEAGGEPFDEASLTWFEALANLASVVLVQRRLHAELARRAHHDDLTGLPNRSLLLDRLGQALLRLERHGGYCGVLFLDLNGFKDVNDRYGHGAGDELLREVARRLGGCLRSSDTAARFGGDEFVVMLPDVRSAENAGQVALRISEALAGPVRVQLPGGAEPHVTVQVSVSVGLAVAPLHGLHAETLCRAADQAMYRAKRDGLTVQVAPGEAAGPA